MGKSNDDSVYNNWRKNITIIAYCNWFLNPIFCKFIFYVLTFKLGGFIVPIASKYLYKWLLKSKLLKNEIIYLRESFEIMNKNLKMFIKDLEVTIDKFYTIKT